MGKTLTYSRPQLSCFSRPRFGLLCYTNGSAAENYEECDPGSGYTSGNCTPTGSVAAQYCQDGTFADTGDSGNNCQNGGHVYDGACTGGTQQVSVPFTCITGGIPESGGTCAVGGDAV